MRHVYRKQAASPPPGPSFREGRGEQTVPSNVGIAEKRNELRYYKGEKQKTWKINQRALESGVGHTAAVHNKADRSVFDGRRKSEHNK